MVFIIQGSMKQIASDMLDLVSGDYGLPSFFLYIKWQKPKT